MSITTHPLKTWPEYYSAILGGIKTFEIRREDDRVFSPGDLLNLLEFNPATGLTGRNAMYRVTYILRSPFLPAGLCAMAIVPHSDDPVAVAAK